MQTVVTIPCARVEDEIRDLCLQLSAAQNEEALLRVIPRLRYAVRELESELSNRGAASDHSPVIGDRAISRDESNRASETGFCMSPSCF